MKRLNSSGAAMNNHIPSKCLYFSSPVRETVEVIEESRNTITLADRIICFRIPSDDELKVAASRNQKIISVVDDDYWGIVKDGRLPLGYRSRMFYKLINNGRQLRRLTDCWVVTSPKLENVYPGAALIDPNWNISNSIKVPSSREGLHLSFLGTRSHLHDLRMILPFIIPFLQDFRATRFTIFLGKHCPKELSILPNVINYEPMSWGPYRDFLQGLNIDVSILPSEQTQVNACRSRNKLFEAVYAGGVCLLDEHYAHKDYAEKYQLGISHNQQELYSLLDTYTKDRSQLTNLQHIARINAVALQAGIIEKQKEVLLSPIN
jgi:hypothetical protein